MMKPEKGEAATVQGEIGFIGAGLMAEALIGGMVQSGLIDAKDIIASDVSHDRLEAVSSRYGIRVTSDNKEVIHFASTIILAIKPQHADVVLAQLRSDFSTDHLIISMMAGVPISRIGASLGSDVAIVRVMPNIATVVEAAASAIALGPFATAEHAAVVEAIFSTVGLVVTVEENLMDAVTGLSGSGPAYVLTVIESLADGGVAEGLSRDTALKLAAQTVLGAAQLILSTSDHPALWRERVTSPAGTTAEGLFVLEERAVRGAFASAVRASAARSRQLGAEEEA